MINKNQILSIGDKVTHNNKIYLIENIFGIGTKDYIMIKGRLIESSKFKKVFSPVKFKRKIKITKRRKQ